ncbi:MAG TPA: hypothetical protein VFC07_03615, partial [Verrucomicrobiae bacterium]|nr:hypothetical protein [Verrucomicrobiae bacterium]
VISNATSGFQPASVALTNLANTNGAALTNLNASALASGTVPAARLTNGIPTGGIIMWSGSIATVPAGWHLCDGTSGTPDLRNRFVVCANADVSGIAKTTVSGYATVTGGSATHSHTGGSLSLNQTGDNSGDVTGDPGGGQVFSSGNPGQVNFQGSTDPASSLAPYYALAFIMKL